MIEFYPEDSYCSWNGILMSPENHLNLFGVEEMLNEGEGWIIDSDGIIYSDLPVGEILMQLGAISEDKKIISFDIHCIEELLDIKPYSKFEIDHPNFCRELYDEFYKELDSYYENKEYLNK